MAAIELQDQTARAITDAAEALGVSVDELLRTRVLGQTQTSSTANGSQDDTDELMTELKALAFDGPVVSDRREDIYSDD